MSRYGGLANGVQLGAQMQASVSKHLSQPQRPNKFIDYYLCVIIRLR